MPGTLAGAVFLTDFGLARSTATGSRFTRTGEALGTPAYMSPEQARGETAALTPATDTWSLGCVLFELLAGGRRAFEGDTPAAVIAAVLTRAPQVPHDLPPSVRHLLAAGLQKAPASRYPTGGAFSADAARVLTGARPLLRLPSRGRPALAVLLVVAAAGLGALAAQERTDVSSPPSRAADAGELPAALRARALRDADPRQAAGLLKEAILAAPARHDLRLERGLLLWASGDGPGAQECWGAIPDDAPQAEASRLYRGLEIFIRLSGEGAKPDLEWVVRRGGRHAALARAVLAAHAEAWADARAELPPAADWPEDVVWGYVDQRDPAGDARAALQHYDRAIAGAPPFAWLRANRGVLRKQLGDLPGAAEDFDAALRLDPDLTEALVNRGALRVAEGDYASAARDYEHALAHNPADASARFARGRLREHRGDIAGAAADYDAALASDPGLVPARVNRGLLRGWQGDLKGAEEDLAAALALDPGCREALLGRGALRAKHGNVDGALSDYDAALACDPSYLKARVNRGVLRWERREHRAALEDFDAALAVDPRHVEALANRALVHRALGNRAAALADLDAALALAPGNVVSLANRGHMRVEAGDLAGARSDLDAAIALDGQQFGSRLNRGLLRERSGDPVGALEDLRIAHALAPAGWAKADGLAAQIRKLEARLGR